MNWLETAICDVLIERYWQEESGMGFDELQTTLWRQRNDVSNPQVTQAIRALRRAGILASRNSVLIELSGSAQDWVLQARCATC